MLGNFSCFLLSSDFSKLLFEKKSFSNTMKVSNCLNPDQDDILSVLIWVQTFCNEELTHGSSLLITVILSDVLDVGDLTNDSGVTVSCL